MHLHSTRQNCFSFGRHPPFSCVATLTTLVASPCRRQSGQEGQCAPQDYRTVWRSGEDDHDHHHHHPGTTELLSISMLKARYGAQKIWAGFLEILCATWGGEVKSTYLAQGCTQLLRVEAFSLEKVKTEKFSHSFDLWAYRNCRRY